MCARSAHQAGNVCRLSQSLHDLSWALLMAYLIISSYPGSLALFPNPAQCTKCVSTAAGNNHGEMRTRCANNYYHVRQRYEVIAYSHRCLLPTNGRQWVPRQGPIRFEGHKQVTKFAFMVVWRMVTGVRQSCFISSLFRAEMSNMRIITAVL